MQLPEFDFNTVARFWSNVNVSRYPGACWPWHGNQDEDGYGTFKSNRVKYRATRVAWSLKNQTEIEADLHVLHTCDNPPCVNPDHLFLGTNLENIADKVSKKRQCKGETHGMTKLTWELVRQIRAEFDAGGISQTQMAKTYGVHYSTVHLVVRRKAWAE